MFIDNFPKIKKIKCHSTNSFVVLINALIPVYIWENFIFLILGKLSININKYKLTLKDNLYVDLILQMHEC
jgi:hypothetical protein